MGIPSSLLANCKRIRKSIVSLRNAQLPSARAVITPPGWADVKALLSV